MQRRPIKQAPAKRGDRHLGFLKKEEADRVAELKTKIIASKGKTRPDVDSTIEMMYLRILGSVKNRAPVEAQLKELRSALDRSAELMNRIIDEAEKQAASK